MELSDKLDIKLTIAPVFGAMMSRYTSFRTGGPADCVVFPVDEAELAQLLKLFGSRGIPYTVLGRVTNVLVTDAGVEGAVIYLSEYKGIEINGHTVTARCGALLSEVASAALGASLSGMECLCGIPGTVGGGVCMNAGAYGAEMKDVVSKAAYIDPLEPEKMRALDRADLKFDYRKSFFSGSDYIVTSATFALEPQDKSAVAERMRACNAKRKEKQPINLPSAGSTFKRPPGYFAAQLIDECGLKGRRVGGASVSEKHAGFIVNDAGATSQDVLDLIALVQLVVFDKTGVAREPEVKVFGRRRLGCS